MDNNERITKMFTSIETTLTNAAGKAYSICQLLDEEARDPVFGPRYKQVWSDIKRALSSVRFARKLFNVSTDDFYVFDRNQQTLTKANRETMVKLIRDFDIEHLRGVSQSINPTLRLDFEEPEDEGYDMEAIY